MILSRGPAKTNLIGLIQILNNRGTYQPSKQEALSSVGLMLANVVDSAPALEQHRSKKSYLGLLGTRELIAFI